MALDYNFQVIIIGGDGFVGSAYKRFCEKNKLNFLVINRANYADYIGVSCEVLINANGNSKKFLAKDNPLLEFDQSVRSVRQSLIDFKSKKYIFLSSCDVYPNCSSIDTTKEDQIIDISQQSPYVFHKYLAEQCVRHCHDNWLIFRMGGFVGIGIKKNPIFDILQGEKIWLDRQSKLQYINTDTAAEIVMSLAQKECTQEIFNLCGNGLINLQEIIDHINSKVSVNPNSPLVKYEVSIDKLKSIIPIPDTRETVLNFIDNFGDRH